MNEKLILIILLIVSLTTLIPQFNNAREIDLLPEQVRSVSLNVYSPRIVLSSTMAWQIKINISYFDFASESLLNITNGATFQSDYELELNKQGLYILEFLTEGSGSVEISKQGVHIENVILISFFTLVNISYYIYKSLKIKDLT